MLQLARECFYVAVESVHVQPQCMSAIYVYSYQWGNMLSFDDPHNSNVSHYRYTISLLHNSNQCDNLGRHTL
jgi:hypothetical protein